PTRPDTVYGMTYAVLAPEHPLVDRVVHNAAERETVARFRAEVSRQSEIERTAVDRPKRGLRLSARVVNPFTNTPVPLFLADYVLIGYGTGAIMAVPGEDERDWEFAEQYGLPIIETVKRPDGWTGKADSGDGVKVNSGFLDGLSVTEARRRATDWLVSRGIGTAKVNYRLRDWGISRQRYWGAPIPVLYCDVDGMVPEAEQNLPVALPRDVQLSGKGGSPLAGVASFVNATCPRCGGPARRETDTMDTFVESSWYFLRYCWPRDGRRVCDGRVTQRPPRFLNRAWRCVTGHMSELRGGQASPPSASPDRSRAPTVPTTEPGRAFRRTIHETIQRVTDDIEREFHFNTAIAAIMELVNALQTFEAASGDGDGDAAAADRTALMREAVETTLLLLGPFCPHVTE